MKQATDAEKAREVMRSLIDGRILCAEAHWKFTPFIVTTTIR